MSFQLPLVFAALLSLAPKQGHAQSDSAPPNAESSLCFGFSFGAWSPPLDWGAAGHHAITDSSSIPRAPDGRGWAANLDSTATASLMLFPAWWPVGVTVEVSSRPVAPADTVVGRATALVADGRTEPPRSRVRVWRVPCRRRSPPPGERAPHWSAPTP